MAGIADIALGAAPIAGGALLGIAAGGLKGPDVRGMIKQDLDLLERIPPEQAQLRTALQRSIDERIADLVAATEKSRQLREIAASYKGNWRDMMVFFCAILFTFIWWHVSHSRTNWLPLFIVMIALTILTGIYAARGVIGSVRDLMEAQRQRRHRQPDSDG
jgi:hypothetical protein